jgi:site-specific recombinase XerD
MSNLPVPIAPGLVTEFRFSLERAHGYAHNDTSDRTRRAYASDFRIFVAWCGEHGKEALPATIETVAAYLAAGADGGLSVSTITRRAAAIAYAHRKSGLDSPTASEAVKAVLRGIRRGLGAAIDRKSPATAAVVASMLRRIPESLTGQRDRALLSIGFAAALRRSELVALDVSDLERTPEGVIVHIRQSKTDQEAVGHSVAIPRGSKLKAPEALDRWLASAGIVEGPLFRRMRKGDRVTADRLTDQSVALIVKRYAAAAGLDPDQFAGHSLRAGFVTSALEHGADLLRVMDVTRHKEVKTLQAYDRRAKVFNDHAGSGFL